MRAKKKRANITLSLEIGFKWFLGRVDEYFAGHELDKFSLGDHHYFSSHTNAYFPFLMLCSEMQ